MNVYIYDADIFCEQCGEEIRKWLTHDGFAPDDSSDELSYDSDEFPKGPYPDGGGEADTPQHCGSGETCYNAIELNDGRPIGVLLNNDLTSEGVEYVREAMKDGNEVTNLWAEYYKIGVQDGKDI